MKKHVYVPAILWLVGMTTAAETAQASHFGAVSYVSCPPRACQPQSYTITCKQEWTTEERTVFETVWENQQVTCMRDVCETVWKEIEKTCYRTETKLQSRECRGVVCKAVCETVEKECRPTVCKPVTGLL